MLALGRRQNSKFVEFSRPPLREPARNKKSFKYPHLKSKGGYLRFFVALQSWPPLRGGPGKPTHAWALGFVSFIFLFSSFSFFFFPLLSFFFSFPSSLLFFFPLFLFPLPSCLLPLLRVFISPFPSVWSAFLPFSCLLPF